MPGTVTSITGPPGLLRSTGPGRFTFMVTADPGSDRPDMEVRFLAPDDTVAHALHLTGVRINHGVDGPGGRARPRSRLTEVPESTGG